jgi:hypothetical protein
MEVNNIRAFMHVYGIEWMRFMNYYLDPLLTADNTALSDETESKLNRHSIVILLSFTMNDNTYPAKYFPSIEYDFPREYFCLFATYPHEKLIFTLTSINNTLCSCTLLWLYAYTALYYQHGHRDLVQDPNGISMCLINDTVGFELEYIACGIPDRIEKCKLQSINSSYDEDIYFQL